MCLFKAFRVPIDKKKKNTTADLQARRLQFQESLFEKSKMLEANSLQNTARTLDDN